MVPEVARAIGRWNAHLCSRPKVWILRLAGDANGQLRIEQSTCTQKRDAVAATLIAWDEQKQGQGMLRTLAVENSEFPQKCQLQIECRLLSPG